MGNSDRAGHFTLGKLFQYLLAREQENRRSCARALRAFVHTQNLSAASFGFPFTPFHLGVARLSSLVSCVLALRWRSAGYNIKGVTTYQSVVLLFRSKDL